VELNAIERDDHGWGDIDGDIEQHSEKLIAAPVLVVVLLA